MSEKNKHEFAEGVNAPGSAWTASDHTAAERAIADLWRRIDRMTGEERDAVRCVTCGRVPLAVFPVAHLFDGGGPAFAGLVCELCAMAACLDESAAQSVFARIAAAAEQWRAAS